MKNLLKQGIAAFNDVPNEGKRTARTRWQFTDSTGTKSSAISSGNLYVFPQDELVVVRMQSKPLEKDLVIMGLIDTKRSFLTQHLR